MKIAKKKPRYLIIGIGQSGKSTLLEASELANRKSLDNDQWEFENAIFYETRHDIDLTKKQCKFKALIIVYNIKQLIIAPQGRAAEEREHLQNTLNSLSTYLKPNTPTYVVITHCDILAGFTEFFDELELAQKKQAWGIQLPRATPKNISITVESRFDTLLSTLHANMMWQLQHARNPSKRNLIQNFPLQFESIRTRLLELVDDLFIKKNREKKMMRLQGIYFTSAIQRNEIIDRFKTPLQQTVTLKPLALYKAPILSQAFFVKGFFDTLLLGSNRTRLSNTRASHWTKMTAIIASATLVSYLTLQGYQSVKNYISTIEKAKQSLVRYQLFSDTKDTSLQALTFQLDDLNFTRNALNTLPRSWINFSDNQNLQLASTNTYIKILQTRVLPILAKSLEEKLSNTHQVDLNTLFESLKIYLMLGDLQHRNIADLERWLQHTGANLFADSSSNTPQLNQHILNAFTLGATPIPLNLNIIKSVRERLRALPESTSAYLDLLNKSSSDPITLFPGNLAHQNISIPSIFTAAHFNETYLKIIPESILEGYKENWILGTKDIPLPSKEKLSAILMKVRENYLAGYLNQWRLVIAQASPQPFTSFADAIKVLGEYDEESDFINSLLNILYINTSGISISGELWDVFNKNITDAYKNINEFTQKQYNKNSLVSVRKFITQLSDQIMQLSSASQPNLAAFNLAKSQFTSSASVYTLKKLNSDYNLPPPLNKWLTQITLNTWALILHGAYDYINQQWQNEVLHDYVTKISNRYPINKASLNDVALDDFTQFFSPQGSLDQFFTRYIQPFVDTQNKLWQAKSIYGLPLLTDEILQQFTRAALIQKMFFPDHSQKPLVHFSLIPKNTFATIQSSLLTYENNQLNSNQIPSVNTAWLWPANNSSNQANLMIEIPNGQRVSKAENGVWALFRLLDHAKISPQLDTEHFTVTFNLDGYIAEYQLVTDQPINPFIANIINNFSLPTTL